MTCPTYYGHENLYDGVVHERFGIDIVVDKAKYIVAFVANGFKTGFAKAWLTGSAPHKSHMP